MDDNEIDSGLTDADILRMSEEEDSGLTDADILRMEGSRGNIQPTEGFLGSIARFASQELTGLGEQNENPLMTGISSSMRGLKQVPGLGPYMIGHDIKSKLMGDIAGKDNPVGGIALDVISDPETLAGGRALFKGIGNVGKNLLPRETLGGFKNILGKSARLKYMDKMENAIYEARSQASPKFKAQLDSIANKNPNVSVDLTDVTQNVFNSSDQSIIRIVEDSPTLQDILTKPGNVTLHEAQSALNELTSKLSSGKLSGVSRRSSDIPVLDLIDDLKLSMSKSFPEIQSARNMYKGIVNDFRAVRGKLKGDAASKNLFADYNPFNPRGKEFMGGERSEEAFKRLVPENTFKEAIGTRRAKSVKDVGTIGAGGLLLESARRKFKG